MRSAREANRRYFRRAYETGEHGWATERPNPHIVALLKRLAREVPAGRLLDIGCGEGRHSIAARKLGFRVVGVDFEPMALSRARRFAAKRGVKGISFRTADVFSLPFPEHSFDVVLDVGCLHHQRKKDWPAYKRSFLRVLKPNGYYLLSVFSPRFRMFAGKRRRWHIAFGSYRRCFVLADVREFLGRDFDILHTREERGQGGGFWQVLARRQS